MNASLLINESVINQFFPRSNFYIYFFYLFNVGTIFDYYMSWEIVYNSFILLGSTLYQFLPHCFVQFFDFSRDRLFQNVCCCKIGLHRCSMCPRFLTFSSFLSFIYLYDDELTFPSLFIWQSNRFESKSVCVCVCIWMGTRANQRKKTYPKTFFRLDSHSPLFINGKRI